MRFAKMRRAMPPFRRIVAALGLLACTAPVAFGIASIIPIYGQILHSTGPLPSFEVATIRPWKPMPRPPLPPSDASTLSPKVMKVSPVLFFVVLMLPFATPASPLGI